ncbi:MAG: hypothetical protein ABH896_04960 [Candidatus Jacksonbacteria bacterium]
MQQLHKQRTKASKVLKEKFKGDYWKFHQWRIRQTEKNLLKNGLIYKINPKIGIGCLHEAPKSKYNKTK